LSAATIADGRIAGRRVKPSSAYAPGYRV
jgi:hypothetical protein